MHCQDNVSFNISFHSVHYEGTVSAGCIFLFSPVSLYTFSHTDQEVINVSLVLLICHYSGCNEKVI